MSLKIKTLGWHQKEVKNLAANEQGLALLGYLKNVCRQLKPNIFLTRPEKS